jgi:hypothetical protein
MRLNNPITGTSGNTALDGGDWGAGDDVIRVLSFAGAETVKHIDGGAGPKTIAGTAVNNTIDPSRRSRAR